jgi:hypothetical protein
MKIIFTSLMLMMFTWVFAQKKPVVHNYSVIKEADWIIPRTDTLDYAFDKALLLKRKIGNYKSASMAYPKKLNFKNGIIEADLSWPGQKGGFIGLAFRIGDAHHYETIYFRPESSGTINAVQYMPEKKPEFNWWDYEADKYQAKATLPLHGWFHVKLIVKDSTLTVFVDKQPKPVMIYNNLDSSLKIGSVGFWLGNCTIGAYKNLVVTSL